MIIFTQKKALDLNLSDSHNTNKNEFYRDHMSELFILQTIWSLLKQQFFMTKHKMCIVYSFAIAAYQIIINLAYFKTKACCMYRYFTLFMLQILAQTVLAIVSLLIFVMAMRRIFYRKMAFKCSLYWIFLPNHISSYPREVILLLLPNYSHS
jgi:hypothetical protein